MSHLLQPRRAGDPKPVALQAWGWLKDLYPKQIAAYCPRENDYCLCLFEHTAGVEMDVRLDVARTQLQFRSAIAGLPADAEHKALVFLEWNRRLEWPKACVHFAYCPMRREVFVCGTAVLTKFKGTACLHDFLHDALDRIAEIKSEALEYL